MRHGVRTCSIVLTVTISLLQGLLQGTTTQRNPRQRIIDQSNFQVIESVEYNGRNTIEQITTERQPRLVRNSPTSKWKANSKWLNVTYLLTHFNKQQKLQIKQIPIRSTIEVSNFIHYDRAMELSAVFPTAPYQTVTMTPARLLTQLTEQQNQSIKNVENGKIDTMYRYYFNEQLNVLSSTLIDDIHPYKSFIVNDKPVKHYKHVDYAQPMVKLWIGGETHSASSPWNGNTCTRTTTTDGGNQRTTSSCTGNSQCNITAEEPDKHCMTSSGQDRKAIRSANIFINFYTGCSSTSCSCDVTNRTSTTCTINNYFNYSNKSQSSSCSSDSTRSTADCTCTNSLLGIHNETGTTNCDNRYDTQTPRYECNLIANLHYDATHNFFHQVKGTKTFYLLPPESWSHLHVYSRLHPSHRQSQIDLTMPVSKLYVKFPQLQAHIEQNMYTVTLQPGDTLYLPPFWFHSVHSELVKESEPLVISVNIWSNSKELNEFQHALDSPLPYLAHFERQNYVYDLNTHLYWLQRFLLHVMDHVLEDLTGHRRQQLLQQLHQSNQRYMPIPNADERVACGQQPEDHQSVENVQLQDEKLNQFVQQFVKQSFDHIRTIGIKKILVASFIEMVLVQYINPSFVWTYIEDCLMV